MDPVSCILTSAVVASVLGAAPPPSSLVLPRATRPASNSVQFFDNLREDLRGKSITNAVLQRELRHDAVRVHMNLLSCEINVQAARRTNEAHEEHCKLRVLASSAPNTVNAVKECGEGFAKKS